MTDATDIIKQCDGDRDRFSDAIHEYADNAVIYTATARAILRESPNEDAIFEQGGDLSGCGSMGEVMCRAAYYAVVQDLWDEIHTYDNDDIHEMCGRVECSECGEWMVSADLDDAGMCDDCVGEE